MAYQKLSDRLQQLANPQRSDAFVKDFKNAVLKGEIEAVYLTGERFELPKHYTRRYTDETYTRSMRDMAFDVTPEFEAWFEEKNRELVNRRRGSAPKANFENVQAGLVDFKALAAATRQNITASYVKGQKLGRKHTKRHAVKAAPQAAQRRK